ncbi:cation:proton antiporter [Microbacterium aurantiacum]|uniref:cation:proton antiporter n=1 Tax=Microbacterium aurantiacum TaxID=162393 RepID=UPI003D7391DF
MSEILAVLGNVFVVLGALVFATAALGVMRFPDAFTRVSAVGTAGGLGIALVVGGAFLVQPTVPDLVKVVLAIAMQLTTSAVGSIAIARAAYLSRSPRRRLGYDELTPVEDATDGSGERT